MSFSYKIYNEIRKETTGQDSVLSNVKALGLPDSTRALHILWMYPDVLNVFGGRGDLMALFRIGCAMKMPVEMRRLNSLSEEIPLDWADLIYYVSGDMTAMEDILKAHRGRLEDFRAYAQSGRMIVAVSSSGAILADKLEHLDGSETAGLGLLHMTMTERSKIHGDDLWIRTKSGLDVIANQIQLADVKLAEDQAPFAEVVYGRGNDGNGSEGAEIGNVVYTGCVGPVLVRNPWLAAEFLMRAAKAAGMDTANYTLPDKEIMQEAMSFEEAKSFVQEKMK